MAGALLLPASCADPPDEAIPGTIVVDRLERQLTGRACIGALDRWERHYSYGAGSAPPAIDRRIIYFTYFEAGVDGFVARRRIERVKDQFIYDGLARVAFGQLNLDTGSVVVDFCGPNNRPVDPAVINSLLSR